MDFDEVCCNIRACLNSSQKQCTLQELNRDYNSVLGESIPFRALGYKSLEELIRKVPRIRTNQCGRELYVDVQPDERTIHIANLVRGQKCSKKKKKRYGRSVYRPPPPRRFNNVAPAPPPLMKNYSQRPSTTPFSSYRNPRPSTVSSDEEDRRDYNSMQHRKSAPIRYSEPDDRREYGQSQYRSSQPAKYPPEQYSDQDHGLGQDNSSPEHPKEKLKVVVGNSTRQVLKGMYKSFPSNEDDNGYSSMARSKKSAIRPVLEDKQGSTNFVNFKVNTTYYPTVNNHVKWRKSPSTQPSSNSVETKLPNGYGNSSTCGGSSRGSDEWHDVYGAEKENMTCNGRTSAGCGTTRGPLNASSSSSDLTRTSGYGTTWDDDIVWSDHSSKEDVSTESMMSAFRKLKMNISSNESVARKSTNGYGNMPSRDNGVQSKQHRNSNAGSRMVDLSRQRGESLPFSANSTRRNGNHQYMKPRQPVVIDICSSSSEHSADESEVQGGCRSWYPKAVVTKVQSSSSEDERTSTVNRFSHAGQSFGRNLCQNKTLHVTSGLGRGRCVKLLLQGRAE